MRTALSAFAGRRVLFLNWRDRSHPETGGSETYVQELAARFAAAGADATLFAAAVQGAPVAEVVDGVTVLRSGSQFGVYAQAARHLRRHRGRYDAVVDVQNGIPFFAPAVAPGLPTVLVVHHVHQAQFDLHFGWPMSAVGKLLEKDVSRIVYGDRPVVAVSPSTREDVRRVLGLRGPIHVVPNGVTALPDGPAARAPSPTLTCVSRMVVHKRLHLLLEAVPALLRTIPDLQVHLAGDGPHRPELERLAASLGLGDVVTFHGFVDEQQKAALLRCAWLTVAPSAAEGWGLTVLEANSVGVPAVAYAVPGLRDAVRPGQTGWLLPEGTDLAPALRDALAEVAVPAVADAFDARCRAWADRFSWDASAERLARVLDAEVRRRGAGPGAPRALSDLAVVAEFASDEPEELAVRLDAGLRGNDTWSRDGELFSVLLHGVDEIGALRALDRLGVRDPVLGLASSADLLGAGGPL